MGSSSLTLIDAFSIRAASVSQLPTQPKSLLGPTGTRQRSTSPETLPLLCSTRSHFADSFLTNCLLLLGATQGFLSFPGALLYSEQAAPFSWKDVEVYHTQ